LNIDGGVHVAELNVPPSLFAAGEEEQTSILGFEDMFTTDPEFEGDYNDVVVAVSQDQLSMTTIQNVVNNLNLVPDEAVVV